MFLKRKVMREFLPFAEQLNVCVCFFVVSSFNTSLPPPSLALRFDAINIEMYALT